jgi:hypothetical protein
LRAFGPALQQTVKGTLQSAILRTRLFTVARTNNHPDNDDILTIDFYDEPVRRYSPVFLVLNGQNTKFWWIRMGYAAVALAVLGFATGLAFRLQFLLPILAALLVISTVVATAQGFGILHSALTVILAQTIMQSGYFLGIVGRSVVGMRCIRSPDGAPHRGPSGC